MASKYIVLIQPQMTKSDADKMEKDLNKRFGRVSEKFGSELSKVGNRFKAVATGIIAGIAAAVISNPFEKVSKDLDDVLAKYGNIFTRAQQFGVSSGKYFQTQEVLKSTGIQDPDAIINRFASMLDEARKAESEGQPHFLQEFTKYDNVIDSFFAATESLRKLEPTERGRLSNQIFGERSGLRVASLLQTDIKARRDEIFGTTDGKELTRRIDELDKVATYQSIERAKRSNEELELAAQNINIGSARAQAGVEQEQIITRMNEIGRIQEYAALKRDTEKMAQTMDEIKGAVTGFIGDAITDMKQEIPKLGQTIKEGYKGMKDILEGVKNNLNPVAGIKNFFSIKGQYLVPPKRGD